MEINIIEKFNQSCLAARGNVQMFCHYGYMPGGGDEEDANLRYFLAR